MTQSRPARPAAMNGGNGHDHLPAEWNAQAFLESASIGIHCVGADGTILWANKAETEMLGYAANEYVGHNIAEFHAGKEVIEEMLGRLAGGETLQNRDAQLRCKDGSIRYVLIDASPVFEGDRFIHTRCFTRDITERKKAEQRLAVQYQVISALAESEGLHEACYSVLALICGYLGWQLGALWSVDDEARVLRCVETWREPEPGLRTFESATRTAVFSQGKGLPGRVWATASPAWIPDVTVDRNFPRAPYAALAGLHAALGFPIRSGGRVIGVIEFFDREIREPDRELLAMMTAIGSQIGQFMRVRLAEAETEASNVELRIRFQQLESVYHIADLLNRAESFEEINEQALTALVRGIGANRAAIKLFDAKGAMRFTVWRGLSEEYRRSADGFSPWPQEAINPQPVLMPDVTKEWKLRADRQFVLREGIQSIAFVPLTHQQRLLGMFSLYYERPHDFQPEEVQLAETIASHIGLALGRKQAEEERRRREEDQRFLANVSVAASASLDYERALGDVASLAVPFLGDWCTVHVTDSRGSLFRAFLVHSDPEKTAQARRLGAYEAGDPDAPFGEALAVRTGAPVLYEDVPRTMEEHRMDAKRREFVEAFGIKSAVMVPLHARGQTLGAISLFTAESGRVYTQADLSLIEEFARRASLAADNARLYSDVQRASSAKDEFLGLVSHELRTPLTGIYGAVRILRVRGDQLAPPDREDLLEVLEHESERMNQLVEDLLVLSRLDLGQEVMLEPVMPSRVVEKVVAGLNYIKGPRPIGIDLELGLPPVAAEPAFFEQILRNLLNNAQKYSPAGTPIEVRVAKAPDGGVSVSVLDRGVGIAPEEAERIFEPFYRSANAGLGKGLGIGLSVCKRLTEAQDGHIWAKPRDGGGVEIGFTLNRYEDEDADAGAG